MRYVAELPTGDWAELGEGILTIHQLTEEGFQRLMDFEVALDDREAEAKAVKTIWAHQDELQLADGDGAALRSVDACTCGATDNLYTTAQGVRCPKCKDVSDE